MVAVLAALGYIPRLVALLGALYPGPPAGHCAMLVPLLRALGNAVAVPDAAVTTEALAAGLLPALAACLASDPPRGAKIEAAWVLSNVAGGLPEHAFALAAGGLVPVLVAFLGADLLLQKEALYTLLNFGDKGPDACLLLLETDYVPGPCARRGG